MSADQLDLGGLERDLRRSNPDHIVLIRVSEALALISQAREAERMRVALAERDGSQ